MSDHLHLHSTLHVQRVVPAPFSCGFAIQERASSRGFQARDPWNEKHVSSSHQACEGYNLIARYECKMNGTGIPGQNQE